MINYILINIIPFFNNFIYFFFISTLLWFAVFIKVKPLETNKGLKMVFRTVIGILFIRYLFELLLIISFNCPPGSPELNFYLIKLSETAYLVLKVIICIVMFSAGLAVLLLGKRAKNITPAEVRPFVIFLFLFCIVEILFALRTTSDALAHLALILSLVNLVPLAICVKSAIHFSPLNKMFLRVFILNSVVSITTILGLGIFVLGIIAHNNRMAMSAEEVFLKDRLEYVDKENFEELVKFTDEVDSLTNFDMYLTQNPDTLELDDTFFEKKIVPIDNRMHSYIVFGSSYSDIHTYIGILFRSWFFAIVFFNLIFSVSYYLYRSKNTHGNIL